LYYLSSRGPCPGPWGSGPCPWGSGPCPGPWGLGSCHGPWDQVLVNIPALCTISIATSYTQNMCMQICKYVCMNLRMFICVHLCVFYPIKNLQQAHRRAPAKDSRTFRLTI